MSRKSRKSRTNLSKPKSLFVLGNRVGRLHFRLCLLLFLYSEEVWQGSEVFLNDESHALGGKAIASEVAVVGLVIHPHGKVAVREEQVADVEVADETGGGIAVVAVAKLSVDEEAARNINISQI